MNYVKTLKEIKEEYPGTIKTYVIDEMLSQIEGYEGTDNANVKSWFLDLQRGGCQSGFVGSLISYYDTHKFFDKYYDNIEEVRMKHEEDFGDCIKINGDLKNFFAWFAFENTAFDIAYEDLKLEI